MVTKPQTEDEEIQTALRAYLTSRNNSSSSLSPSLSSLPTWAMCDDKTWAGTPSYIPSSTKAVSVETIARRQRTRPRPVPRAATCMAISQRGDFLAVAYNLSKFVHTIVRTGKRKTHHEAHHDAWRLLLIGVYDIRARNVAVRWLVAGDIDEKLGALRQVLADPS